MGRTLGGAFVRFAGVVIVAVTFAFFVESLTPGVGRDGLGPLERYTTYWSGLLDPAITARVLRALPYTLAIMGIATVLAVTLGTLVGAWLGGRGREHPRLSAVAWAPILVLACVPAWLIGMGLIALFTHSLRVLPPALPFTPTQTWNDPVAVAVDLATHALLPIVAVAFAGIGASAVTMRALVVGVSTDDHALYAGSLGLAARRITLAHHLRPALAPQATAIALGLGLAVGGAILVEALFSYPGLGFMLWRAVQQTDLPMMRTLTFVLILGVALATLVIDLALPFLDPRIRR